MFENLEINLEKNDSFPNANVFSVASVNGGGKSTLLQFVFTMLHCFMDNDKKEYIKNLLENEVLEDGDIARFEISANGEDYYLDFLTRPVDFAGKNFNLFLDIEEIKKSVETNRQNMKKHEILISLKKRIEDSDRVTFMLKRKMDSLGKDFINSKNEDELFNKARTSNSIDDYKNFINTIVNSNDFTIDSQSELELMYEKTKNDLENLENFLKEESLLYITHLRSKNVLLLRSNMDNALLEQLSRKVFLTAPSSQVFLFLSRDDKQSIFYDFDDGDYDDIISSTKRTIDGFFTYDFVSTEVILRASDKAFNEDRKMMRVSGAYSNNAKQLQDELNDFLDGKTISFNEDEEIKFEFVHTDKELLPEDLSHGELKKLSIYVWLKYLVDEGSIVLMDEMDIALHPTWQYEILEELSKWSKNTQFFLATHSPQILSSTYYKNLIVLDKQDSIATAKQWTKTPRDRDINAILKEIMGADYIPEYLVKLHDEYRELVESGKVDTKEAQEKKAEILEYENENSSFFQGIAFDLELMK